MTSAINPNNIDGTYPIAGQDNNTQGFRDNFTNTKTNFQAAADEITDLQNKVVLKAALTGSAVPDNNMNGQLITAAKLAATSYAFLPIPSTSGPVSINYAAGQYQSIRPSGNIELNFTNFPTAGSAGMMQLAIDINTNPAYTVRLPSTVTDGIVGLQGYSGNVISFAANGIYQFGFTTTNGGSNVTIYDLSRPLLGSPAAAVGYAAGTGGTVTQSTNKSNGVTLDKRCGQITMNGASLAAGDEVSFILTNSFIAATDVVVASIASGATAGAYSLEVDAVGAGSCRFSIGNHNVGSLSEAVVINFVVIKSVNA